MGKSILYISPYLEGKSFGGSIVSWSNLELARKLSPNVKCISIGRDISSDVNYNVVGSKSKAATAFYNLLTISGRMSFSSLLDIDDIVTKNKPDIIYLDSSYLGILAMRIKKQNPSIRVVTFFHNVEFDFELNRLKKGELRYLPSLFSCVFNERRAVKYSDQLISLHRTDAVRISELYGRLTNSYLPISLNINVGSSKCDSGNKIGFLGSAFYANIEAAKIISNEIAPKLQNHKFLIAGRGFEKYKQLLERDNVEVLGELESVDQFYNSVSTILAPILTGGGMKVKIAEAFAYNKRVIASQFCLIGYDDVVNNVDVFSFSSNCQAIDILRNNLDVKVNTRSIFEGKYSNVAMAQRFTDIIDGC